MCKLFKLLGILLFISFFIYAGYQKYKEPEQYSQRLIKNYTKFHALIVDQYEFKLYPVNYINPTVITTHAKCIMQGIGIFQIVASIMILFAVPGFGFLLSVVCFFTILIFHNPFTAESKQQYIKETYIALQYLALLGIAQILCCQNCGKKDSCCSAKKVDDTKKQQ